MAEAFLQLSAQDRRDALEVAASASGRSAHLLEKDAWVVWALATLFILPSARPPHLSRFGYGDGFSGLGS